MRVRKINQKPTALALDQDGGFGFLQMKRQSADTNGTAATNEKRF